MLSCANGQEAGAQANAKFDEQFGAGMTALRAGETSKAYRAFTKCRDLANSVSVERRPAAAFAADLFVAETIKIVGQAPDAKVHAQTLELANAAIASGAWTQPGAEALRLRALVLRSRTAPPGRFRRDLRAEDRAWLLRDDFFAIAPARLVDLHTEASVLRFQLAQGTERELAMLRELVDTANELSDDDPSRTAVFGTLANYHADRRSFDRAQIYVDRMPPADSLVPRAWLALQREDHGQAQKLARELIAKGRVQGHQLLAEALEASGKAEQALPHYDRALAAALDQGSIAAAQNGRGDCLLLLDRLEEAKLAYDAAMAACDDGTVGLVAEAAETLKDRGRLAERRGDPRMAFVWYVTALFRGEEARERLLADAFGGSWLRIHRDQATAIDGLLRTWPDRADPWTAVHAMELGRSRGALDLASRGATPIDTKALQALVRERLEASDPKDIEEVAAKIDALRVATDVTRAAAAVPEAEALATFAKKHAHATMLSWWLGREQGWLVVIRGDDVTKFELGSAADCRKWAAAAYRAVASPNGEVTALESTADLLLPKAARQHFGEVVLAVVDPTMARLPVAALIVDGRPFGVRHAVVQAPSLAVAKLLDERASTGSGRVIVEAPEHTALTRRLGLDPLKFAERECGAVLAAHGAGSHLRGDGATMAALTATRPDLLHIAAHAIDCPGLPTQSLLLLADGPHPMGSLGGLDLPGTLVVLSSCAAATGEQRGHEGVVGLVEGMFAAGARGVLAPVAGVNQQATADFMKVFHEALAAGQPPAFAVRQARRTLAATDNYAHPHYWGSFALFSGIPEPQNAAPAGAAPNSRRTIWLAIAGVIGIGVVMLLPRQKRDVGLR